MAQNIYDDPEFFRGYGQLPRSVDGLDGAAEWPSLRSLVPPLNGLRVLDLGCGFGWFCRWAREHGAASVLGLDVSENMLARAAADTDDAAITYRREDLDLVTLPEGAFDMAFSSLTLHYLHDLRRLFTEVRQSLTAGSRFVCSVEHPLFTAPSNPDWVIDDEGHRTWPLDGYLREGPRTTNWFAPGVVKQHRTVGTYVRTLLETGFALSHLEDWGPTDAELAAHPDWDPERDRPTFMLFAATAA